MNSSTQEPPLSSSGDGEATAHPQSRTTLRRPATGRMIAGVAAGMARSLGIDVTIIRVGFALLAIIGFTGFALAGIPLALGGIPLYLACWLLIPEDGSEHSIAATMLHSARGRGQ